MKKKTKNSSKQKGYLKPKNPPVTSYLYTVFPRQLSSQLCNVLMVAANGKLAESASYGKALM